MFSTTRKAMLCDGRTSSTWGTRRWAPPCHTFRTALDRHDRHVDEPPEGWDAFSQDRMAVSRYVDEQDSGYQSTQWESDEEEGGRQIPGGG